MYDKVKLKTVFTVDRPTNEHNLRLDAFCSPLP